MRARQAFYIFIGLAFCLAKAQFSAAQSSQQVPDWLLDNQRGETLSFYKDSDGKLASWYFGHPLAT